MNENGEEMFKQSMEKINNNLEGKNYIAVVTDAIKANAEEYLDGLEDCDQKIKYL